MTVVSFTSNQGIVSALNTGVALSRGRFVARMDADDICMPDRLERQVAFLDGHPRVDVVGGSVLMFKSGTKLVKVRNYD
jgi:glycosyltransferase involved in cell wall biosynthesis